MILIREHTASKIILNKKRGISLVEIVAALAIFTVLFIGVSGLIISGIKSENSTNDSLKATSVVQGVRDTLYNESGEFFKKYLENKNVRFEINNVYSIQGMLTGDIKEGIIKATDNTYISKSSKNNPIKYIVYIDTNSLEEDKGLYFITLSVITLNKSQYYYYENNRKIPNIGEVNLETKGVQVVSEQLIVRPINEGDSTNK